MHYNKDEILLIVQQIDEHTKQFPDTDDGNEQLLVSFFDDIAAFKNVMDTTLDGQMEHLCSEYKGFYRFAKLVEKIAKGNI